MRRDEHLFKYSRGFYLLCVKRSNRPEQGRHLFGRNLTRARKGRRTRRMPHFTKGWEIL